MHFGALAADICEKYVDVLVYTTRLIKKRAHEPGGG